MIYVLICVSKMEDQTLELMAMVNENQVNAKRGGLVKLSNLSHGYSRLFFKIKQVNIRLCYQ